MSHETCVGMKLENKILKDLESHAEEFRLTLEACGNHQRLLIKAWEWNA